MRKLQPRVSSLPFLAFALLVSGTLHAATVLLGFEQDAELAAMKWASQGQSRLERSPRFATVGDYSLLFTSPTWAKGMPEWPAFEARPSVTNWTGFDRLVVDITNPHPERHHFALFVSDRKVPIRKGLSFTFVLPAQGYRRFVVPLSRFPKEVNRSDIGIMHFFTERPKTGLGLHLDNVVLLRPGETLPEPDGKFVRDLASLTGEAIRTSGEIISKSRQAAEPFASTPVLRASIQAQFAAFETRLDAVRTELAAPGLILQRLDAISAELASLPGKVERTLAVVQFQKACSQAGQLADRMLVGYATSMEKILPRGMPFSIQPARDVEISLARNEKESFQLLVLPVSGELRRVSVTASDLVSANGAVFKRENVQCEVVGYVETKQKPPYGTSHIGWWPDPILNFLGPVDVAAGDLQSFWIRVRTTGKHSPGIYRGTLTVGAEGVTQLTVNLSVRIFAFTLPDHSPLPLAITFAPHDYPADEKQPLQGDYRNSPEYPVNAWKKHKLAWADFLADYYINYDSLYRSGPPDFEVIKRLRDRGQLVAFNLGIFDRASRDTAAASNCLAGLRTAYEQAKSLGVLDQAYIYGFDECKPEAFPLLEKTAQTLRREFPRALLMTTSYDHSYGQDTVVKTMDAWCPLTPSFKPDQAAKARAAGKQVWWYICCGPHHPHANMFIEYPAIEARLLMGAMTAAQRPDGFLYYQISIWNSRKPITSGPFTDWDPRSWTTYHGDGSWTCVGPNGLPVPTIRLENFRDGLEDFAYVAILEEVLRQRQMATPSGEQSKLLREATNGLAVPQALMKKMTDYSRNPADLYAWRNQLGKLIEESGLADVNPWGKNFGVRGMEARQVKR